ncbi:PRC-barrel domain-containing protein [Devosia sp. RR2S18]|uniref:PRC-barrel domain-containing protein n=1 Tax=Devosia rhizosphaerae TaxID=3049774 RepID=UPI00253FF10C|nr:PRC-barrel domain-containing protein [Devosia sp. RR2S18]WIJ26096.1 PRC-barrel domain-containing protein [Devosia sp. RR2S18]
MIRTLLTSTAVAMLMTAGAVAQDAVVTELAPANEMAPGAEVEAVEVETVEVETVEAEPADTNAIATTGMAMEPWEMNQGYTMADTDNLATELMDMPVYSSAMDDADEIGNITDMVFNEQGQIQAVIVGVGGFLGIGEKSVSVPFDQLQFVVAEDNTERWVVETTAEELEQAPDFITRDDNAIGAEGIGGAMDPAADENLLTDSETIGANDPNAVVVAPAPAAGTTGSMAPATDPALVETETMGTEMGLGMEREGYAAVEVDALTADNLTGATVVGPTGEDIAEVGDILLSQDGRVEAMLIDFGGFLGIGQKRVAVGMENLQFAANEGGDLLVYTDFTQEQLEAQPEFDEELYRQDPNSMLVTDM